MKLDELTKSLERELDWRFAELATLKFHAISTAKVETSHRCALRTMLAMLYAHYEGYCKTAWTLYLEHILSLGLARKRVKPDLATFSMSDVFRSLRGDLSANNLWAFAATEFNNYLNLPLVFDEINTRSNLYPDLAREISVSLDLPYTYFVSHYTLLKSLVGRRNEIAHGKPNFINSVADYMPFENAVTDVLYGMALDICEACERQTFIN